MANTRTILDGRNTLLESLRKERLWTQGDLAFEAGVTIRTIQNAEAGLSTDLLTKRLILQAFGLSPRGRKGRRVFRD